MLWLGEWESGADGALGLHAKAEREREKSNSPEETGVLLPKERESKSGQLKVIVVSFYSQIHFAWVTLWYLHLVNGGGRRGVKLASWGGLKREHLWRPADGHAAWTPGGYLAHGQQPFWNGSIVGKIIRAVKIWWLKMIAWGNGQVTFHCSGNNRVNGFKIPNPQSLKPLQFILKYFFKLTPLQTPSLCYFPLHFTQIKKLINWLSMALKSLRDRFRSLHLFPEPPNYLQSSMWIDCSLRFWLFLTLGFPKIMEQLMPVPFHFLVKPACHSLATEWRRLDASLIFVC